MRLATEIQDFNFPSIYQEFSRLIGEGAWTRMARKARDEIKGNRFLEGWLRRHHRMVFALEEITEYHRKHGRLIVTVASSVEIYEACVLVVQFIDIVSHLDKRKANALTGRLRGGLSNPSDMRALQFELQVATHLANRGFDVEFPETDGTSVFDIRATREDADLEIECKFISSDKGRMVRRRDALEIHHLLERELRGVIQDLQVGLILQIVFNGRPPKTHNERLDVAHNARRVLLGGDASQGVDYEIRVRTFELKGSPFLDGAPSRDDVASFLARFGIANRETMVVGKSAKGAVIFSLESAQPDRLLSGVFQTVSDAAKRQLTGRNAGVVCVKFDDLTADQMLEIGLEAGEPTALRVASSGFLASSASENLAVLAFFADGVLEQAVGGAITRSGRTYQFVNEANPAAQGAVVGLFR